MTDSSLSDALVALRDQWEHKAIHTSSLGERIAFDTCVVDLDPLILRCEALEAQIRDLDLTWAAASEFIRDIHEALGMPQPDSESTVNLPRLAFSVLGQIEELKVRCEALEQQNAELQARLDSTRMTREPDQPDHHDH